jgi:hypothetical protein
LFNVATSRAKRHTIIIADKEILGSYPQLDEEVKTYAQKHAKEFQKERFETPELLDVSQLDNDQTDR